MTQTTETARPTNLITQKVQKIQERHEAAGTGGVPSPDELETTTVAGHERIDGPNARWLMVALEEIGTVSADAYGATRTLLVGPEGKPYLAGDGNAEGIGLPWLELTHSWESALGQMGKFVRFAEKEGWAVEGKKEYERIRACLN